jgi:hypothetical protein
MYVIRSVLLGFCSGAASQGQHIEFVCYGAVFEPFQDAKTNTLLPKVAFVALNLAAMGLGLWKVRTLISVC